jgi:hypothetical protein
MNFLKSFGAWSVFTCLPPLVLVSTDSSQFRTSDLLIFLPFLLISAAGCAILWIPWVRRHTKGAGWVTGILLGIFLPFLAGLVYVQLYPSFEDGPILPGAVLMAVPGGIGGGIAGWLRSRHGRNLAKGPVGSG